MVFGKLGEVLDARALRNRPRGTADVMCKVGPKAGEVYEAEACVTSRRRVSLAVGVGVGRIAVTLPRCECGCRRDKELWHEGQHACDLQTRVGRPEASYR